VRSIKKEECLNRVVVLGESHLRFILQQYIEHDHGERNHQGLDNRLVEPAPAPMNPGGEVHRRERIGGLLNYYHRAAASAPGRLSAPCGNPSTTRLSGSLAPKRAPRAITRI
jgi:hypothetical protein